MKSRILGTAILTMLLFDNSGLSQSLSGRRAAYSASTSDASFQSLHAFSSSRDRAADADSAAATSAILPAPSTGIPQAIRPFSRIGIDSHVGLGGVGFDVATPLSRKFNLRAGSDFFSYSTSFQEQGANVAIDFRLRSGHASLDWFPFGGRFRLSPQVVFANNNRMQATAVIPPGSTVTLNGQDYVSSATDPLHGSGSVDFRRTSPGFTLGFGNIVPRKRSHISIPTELGFYYVGQPGLKVNFSGSACDPTLPPAIGCQPVMQDAGFQKNLAAFIARNNNNLSYASFFPVLSVGFGYMF
ncbi:MAG TPA: hypothetical protein VM554_07020 [Acidisarcina sp.]|nr:hypothetical protein [Acidisarcina sp.]